MRELTPTEEKYILQWGERGSRWGVNRSVAQIHALLMISEEPIHAEDISNALGIARSNTSNSLKELVDMNIVKIIHKKNDRKDYFETLPDVWDLFWAVGEQRVNKELRPTVKALSECLTEMEADDNTTNYAKKRIKELHEFADMTVGFYDKAKLLPTETILKMVSSDNMLDKLKGLFGK